jgi:hypothetical protein
VGERKVEGVAERMGAIRWLGENPTSYERKRMCMTTHSLIWTQTPCERGGGLSQSEHALLAALFGGQIGIASVKRGRYWQC